MKYRVWGIAAGHGSTADASPGALCWREYTTQNFPRDDWREIIGVQKIGAPA